MTAAAPTGVWLSPTDEPAQAVPLFGSIELIAVQFPKFGERDTEVRGASTLTLAFFAGSATHDGTRQWRRRQLGENVPPFWESCPPFNAQCLDI